jgi:hypothetical protein
VRERSAVGEEMDVMGTVNGGSEERDELNKDEGAGSAALVRDYLHFVLQTNNHDRHPVVPVSTPNMLEMGAWIVIRLIICCISVHSDFSIFCYRMNLDRILDSKENHLGPNGDAHSINLPQVREHFYFI